MLYSRPLIQGQPERRAALENRKRATVRPWPVGARPRLVPGSRLEKSSRNSESGSPLRGSAGSEPANMSCVSLWRPGDKSHFPGPLQSRRISRMTSGGSGQVQRPVQFSLCNPVRVRHSRQVVQTRVVGELTSSYAIVSHDSRGPTRSRPNSIAKYASGSWSVARWLAWFNLFGTTTTIVTCR